MNSLKKILKKVYYNAAFTPLYTIQSADLSEPRPYWGVTLKGQLGGPVSRTLRMKNEFGDFPWNPNIIHVNSAWDPLQFDCAIRMKRRGVRMVFNQNGHYYPAWFKGNFKIRNEAMARCQREANFVIFQSLFARETQRALTGFVPANHAILHNCVPMKAIQKEWTPKDKISVLLTGVFAADSEHILRPALEAISELQDKFVLIIAGPLWPLPSLAPLMEKLKKSGALILQGSYDPSSFKEKLRDIDFALHLKYKDCCPNAVVEKMLSGVPLIYSDSGGTPELIGESGIGLRVRDTWDEMVPVETDDLIRAIKKMANSGELYSEKTWNHAKVHHSWDRYVSQYREVFEKVLGNC